MSTVARNGHLITDWTTMCRYLGLDDFDIESITYRHTGARERCYQSLVRWTDIANATGQRLSVNVLLQVLRRSNCHQLAGNLTSRFFLLLLKKRLSVGDLRPCYRFGNNGFMNE